MTPFAPPHAGLRSEAPPKGYSVFLMRAPRVRTSSGAVFERVLGGGGIGNARFHHVRPARESFPSSRYSFLNDLYMVFFFFFFRAKKGNWIIWRMA